MTKPKFLITGASSGLGRYLLEELQGIPFNRKNMENEINNHSKDYYDAIIHCAVDARNTIPPDELLAYHESNVELTRKLTQIPHGLFVYISSPAVYPNSLRLNKETDIPNIPEVGSPVHHTYYLYGLFKLLSEQIVSRYAKTHLILRCTHILGRTSRKSSNIIKVLRDDRSQLTLSPDSTFNFVSTDQIKKFIELALTRNITGTFNVGSSQHITLREIAKAVGSKPNFGKFVHNVHQVDTAKIREISSDFNKSSLELAIEAAQELRH